MRYTLADPLNIITLAILPLANMAQNMPYLQAISGVIKDMLIANQARCEPLFILHAGD
jgi:hypothetical protein